MRTLILALALALTACAGDDDATDDPTDTDGTDTDAGDTDEAERDVCDVRPLYAGCTATGSFDFVSDGGTLSVTWDAEGNKTEQVWDGQRLDRRMTWSHDDAGRVLQQVEYRDGREHETVDYTYDDDGNRTEARRGNGAVERWTYDEQGRLTGYAADWDDDGEDDRTCTTTWVDGEEWDYEERCSGEQIITRVKVHAPSGGVLEQAIVAEDSEQVLRAETRTYRDDCQPLAVDGVETQEESVYRLRWEYDEAGRLVLQTTEVENQTFPYFAGEEFVMSCD